MKSVHEEEIMAFDPREPKFRANPYPTYAMMRTLDPIHYRPAHDDWILTRYADIMNVMKDANFGHAEWQDSAQFKEDQAVDRHPLLRFRLDSQRLMRLWVLLQNPDTHTRLRKAMHRPFTPRLIKALQEKIDYCANQLIDQVEAAGEFDLIHDFAHLLPTTIISDMLGIPPTDYVLCGRLSTNLAYLLDLDVSPIDSERGYLAFSGFIQYFRRQIAQADSSSEREENLLANLIKAHKQGQLSEDELLAHCTLLFFAGHSTTQHLIGNGMLALLQHPQQWQRLQSTPDLIGATVQECLRYDTSAQIISRTALSDGNVGGKTIRKGQRVHLILGAANRDPAQFAEPDRFDIQRQPNPHLSFGFGIHYCFGAPLGQLLAEIAITTLARRLPNLMPQTDLLEWEDKLTVRGLKRLPVTFKASRRTVSGTNT